MVYIAFEFNDNSEEFYLKIDNIYPYKMMNKTFEFKIYKERSSKYIKIKRKKIIISC